MTNPTQLGDLWSPCLFSPLTYKSWGPMAISQVSSFPAHCVIKASAGAERLAAVKPAQLAAATWTKGPSGTPRLAPTGTMLRICDGFKSNM